MTDGTKDLEGDATVGALLDSATEDFAQQIADSVESFLLALRAIAEENDAGSAISLLLLEISQMLAGRCPARRPDRLRPTRRSTSPTWVPRLISTALRLRLAAMLDCVDTYTYVFDPYVPELVESQLSDDLTAIASDLENGLRHYRAGDVDEALWWWQFSYVSSWGNLAGVSLNALLSVVSHNRLDEDFAVEVEDVAVADEMLDESDSPAL